jgi:hypothetical protein
MDQQADGSLRAVLTDASSEGIKIEYPAATLRISRWISMVSVSQILRMNFIVK